MRLLINVNVAWFLLSHRIGIARAARDAGFEVHVAGDVDSPEEAIALEREGLRFHRVRLGRGSLSPVDDLSYLWQLGSVMRSVRPDLVHNVTIKPMIYGTIAARAIGVSRVVNAVSGLGYVFTGGRGKWVLSRFVQGVYRIALRQPDVRVIFQNQDDMRKFVEAGIVDSSQAVLIRGSGVDLDVFQFSPEPLGSPVVVLPARMLRDKGVVEFAKAASMLRSRGSEAEFLLAGKLDRNNPSRLSEIELKQLVDETGVRWLGHMNDMPALYRNAHVVCLPSYREGMPKALLEACAIGRPIVTTNTPGCRDVVRNGENGILVEPRNVQALASGLEKIIADGRLRRQMGRAGRTRAESEFDVRLTVGATLDLYRQMLA